jgi:hypothetical protein
VEIQLCGTMAAVLESAIDPRPAKKLRRESQASEMSDCETYEEVTFRFIFLFSFPFSIHSLLHLTSPHSCILATSIDAIVYGVRRTVSMDVWRAMRGDRCVCVCVLVGGGLPFRVCNNEMMSSSLPNHTTPTPPPHKQQQLHATLPRIECALVFHLIHPRSAKRSVSAHQGGAKSVFFFARCLRHRVSSSRRNDTTNHLVLLTLSCCWLGVAGFYATVQPWQEKVGVFSSDTNRGVEGDCGCRVSQPLNVHAYLCRSHRFCWVER